MRIGLLTGVRLLIAMVTGCCLYCLMSMGAYASTANERAFEMVSPLYKGGFGATFIEAVAQDGGSVAFFSPGEFVGAPAGLSNNANGLDYLSSRDSSGWSTVPIMPPDKLAPYVNYHDISPALSTTLALAKPGPSVEAAALEGSEDQFLLHSTDTADTSAAWSLVGIPLKTLTDRSLSLFYEGGSVDFCHLLFVNSEFETGEEYQLVSEAIGAQLPLYELNAGCHGEVAGVHLVAVNQAGKPISPQCNSEAGIFQYETRFANTSNAISNDGSEVFFTTCVGNQFDHQLFVRLGGAKTIEVSRPVDPHLEVCGEQQIPCPRAAERASANFAGASETGSKVFFTTTASLDSSDQDGGRDLYMAEIGCPVSGSTCSPSSRRVTGMIQVSSAHNGEEAGVEGVVRMAPDGSRVYFVASGDLLSAGTQETMESEGRAVPHTGAENFYVYDATSRQVAFIGDLCTGYQESGNTEDSRCASKTGSDKSIWSETSGHKIQVAGVNGRYLVFATYAQLTAGDTDVSKDIYRYDAETGSLKRVSIGEEGYASNGNGAFDADITEDQIGASVQSKYELKSRTISENGSRIIFITTEPLSPAAINHLANVYEWHESSDENGRVSLVSGGSGGYPITDAVISAEGNDVFFVSTQGLVPQDTDGEADIYDARVHGGFAPEPAPREPCSGDECQGPLTNPAPLLVSGSATQVPEKNTTTRPKTSTRPKAKKKAHRKPKRKPKPKAKHSARTHGHHVTTRGRGLS
jgi:hypothetical protein